MFPPHVDSNGQVDGVTTEQLSSIHGTYVIMAASVQNSLEASELGSPSPTPVIDLMATFLP